jgi:hypothetical protein
MTLDELLPRLPLSYAEGKTYALVMAQDIVTRLEEIQAEHPSKHIAKPVPLTNGTFMLSGDILSEVGPGGLFEKGFGYLNPPRFNEVTVIPWADALALLPQHEEELI